jgi:hypothetical protein
MNSISYIYNSVKSLNDSKFFAAIIMLTLNIGSRYATFNFSKSQEEYIRNSIARELLIFSIVWMGTRDIFISITMTASFVILAEYLFNEKSKFCIMPEKYKNLEKILDSNNDKIITDEEIKQAETILLNARKQKKKINQLSMINYMNEPNNSYHNLY